jgi:hypothetical protein
MEEPIKTLRTMREFIYWYEECHSDNIIPDSMSLPLKSFYIKFKYLVNQEDEANEYLKNFLG